MLNVVSLKSSFVQYVEYVQYVCTILLFCSQAVNLQLTKIVLQ